MDKAGKTKMGCNSSSHYERLLLEKREKRNIAMNKKTFLEQKRSMRKELKKDRAHDGASPLPGFEHQLLEALPQLQGIRDAAEIETIIAITLRKGDSVLVQDPWAAVEQYAVAAAAAIHPKFAAALDTPSGRAQIAAICARRGMAFLQLRQFFYAEQQGQYLVQTYPNAWEGHYLLAAVAHHSKHDTVTANKEIELAKQMVQKLPDEIEDIVRVNALYRKIHGQERALDVTMLNELKKEDHANTNNGSFSRMSLLVPSDSQVPNSTNPPAPLAFIGEEEEVPDYAGVEEENVEEELEKEKESEQSS